MLDSLILIADQKCIQEFKFCFVLDIKIQRDGDNFKNIRRLLITLKKNFFPLHPPWHCINLLLLNGWSNRLIFWYPFYGLICKYFESFYLIQKWDAFVLLWYFLLEIEAEYDFYLHFYHIRCIFWYFVLRMICMCMVSL